MNSFLLHENMCVCIYIYIYMRWVQVTKSCTLSTSLDLTKSNSKKYEPINIDYYIIYYPFFF